MKAKKLVIYLLAIVILLISWGVNYSARTTHGVTGATVTPPSPFGIIEFLQIAVLVLFFISAVIIQKYPKPYLRYGILIFAIIFLGLYKKVMFTTGSLLLLASGNWLPLAGNIFIYTIFLLILITSLLGRDTYCNYCCPFGAIQQLLYKISPFKLKFNRQITGPLGRFRYIFLWLVLVTALLLDDFGIARLDPFATMFTLKGNWLGWMQLGLILGFSLIYYRIWCYYFCPAGAAVSIIGNIPRLKKIISKEPVSYVPYGRDKIKEAFKKPTTYIFLIVFLLILIFTLVIIVANLAGKTKSPAETKQGSSKSPAAHDFNKYGINPKEAMYYD